MKPDIDAIRARASGTAASPHRQGRRDVPRNEDALTLLAYIDELERRTTYTVGETEVAHRIATLEQELRDARAAFESCNRARRHCEDECASLRARACITDDAGEASLINTLEHMLAEERENVDTLRARVADLEAEVATLRHRDALLKRVHGALADMCCRVPTSIDEPVDHIVRLSLARANQRFVDEYDLRVSAQDWANDLRAELFDWQHAVEYVLGDNWCSADGHDAKAARKALAEWAQKAQGDAPQLLAEITELKARIAVLEAMKP